MNYSSVLGHDMMNGDTYIDTVMSERIAAIFYSRVRDFSNVIDFGGGIFGITIQEVLEKFDTASKLRKYIGTKNITLEESKNLFSALQQEMGNRPYAI